jgi:hypothetical protein
LAAEPDAGPAYRLLVTLRMFARERLREADEAEAAAERYRTRSCGWPRRSAAT